MSDLISGEGVRIAERIPRNRPAGIILHFNAQTPSRLDFGIDDQVLGVEPDERTG